MVDTYLGRVDVSGLFLQQFGWRLCKAKSVLCSCSTSTDDNAAETSAKCGPKGSSGKPLLLLSVIRAARHLSRITTHHSSFCEHALAITNKI